MDRRRGVGGALWPVGGPGWRGRLISHAPQLGRMVMALSCPRSTRHAPTAPLTRGSGASCRSEPGILSARTLRGFDSATPSGREVGWMEAMAAAHPAGHESGMVGDHATLVSPAMARAAAPWWGDGDGDGGEGSVGGEGGHEGIGVVCDGVVAVGGAADDDNVELYFVWDVAGADVGLCCPGEVADFFSVYCIEWVEVGVGASLYFDENDAGVVHGYYIDLLFADSCVGFDDCIAFGCDIFAGDVFAPLSDVVVCGHYRLVCRSVGQKREIVGIALFGHL